MKKLLQLLSLIFLTLSLYAQQTEDDVYVGKSRTFGNYRGTDIKTAKQTGLFIIKGTVIKVDWCEEDCLTVWIKQEDGSIVSVGTKEKGFTVPKKIIGKRIIVEGIEPSKYLDAKNTIRKEKQKDIPISATGIRIFE